MNSDHDKLLERQARVYEVLDYATKPAQWFIGGLQLLFLGLCVAGVIIGTPVYFYFTGGVVTQSQVIDAFLALASVILFFAAPYYFVFGGVVFIGVFGLWLEQHPHQTVFQAPWKVLLCFVSFGYAQRLLRWIIKKAIS